MKAVTVKSVDVSPGIEIKDCFRKHVGYKEIPEERIENYIKLNMGLE